MRILSCLILFLSLIGVVEARQPATSITIVSPTSGSTVASFFSVTGTFANLPQGAAIEVWMYDSKGIAQWNTTAVHTKNGTWSASGLLSVGTGYYIIAQDTKVGASDIVTNITVK